MASKQEAHCLPKAAMAMCIAAVAVPLASDAAPSAGAVAVRIQDGAASRCINAATDQVWLSMRRIIIGKKSGFLTTDKYAGIVVGTTISGNTGGQTKKVTFPRMVEATVENYPDGRGLSIPVEFGLIEGLRLQGTNAAYSNIEFDFNVIKGKKKTGWGQALDALVEVTKVLPMPANPFTDGFTYFANYANSVTNAEVEGRKSDNLKQGQIHLSFSPNGRCSNDAFESTGTIAVVFAAPVNEADGVIDIGKANDYCWSAETRPAFTLKFGLPSANGVCEANKAVRNDYYGFFLNAVPTSIEAASGLREDSLLRVDATNSVSTAKTFAFFGELGLGDQDLRNKVMVAATQATAPADLPFGEVIARTDENTVIWRASGVESTAFDLVEALRRCEAHGVPAERCLSAVNVAAPNQRDD